MNLLYEVKQNENNNIIHINLYRGLPIIRFNGKIIRSLKLNLQNCEGAKLKLPSLFFLYISLDT